MQRASISSWAKVRLSISPRPASLYIVAVTSSEWAIPRKWPASCVTMFDRSMGAPKPELEQPVSGHRSYGPRLSLITMSTSTISPSSVFHTIVDAMTLVPCRVPSNVGRKAIVLTFGPRC